MPKNTFFFSIVKTIICNTMDVLVKQLEDVNYRYLPKKKKKKLFIRGVIRHFWALRSFFLSIFEVKQTSFIWGSICYKKKGAQPQVHLYIRYIYIRYPGKRQSKVEKLFIIKTCIFFRKTVKLCARLLNISLVESVEMI